MCTNSVEYTRNLLKLLTIENTFFILLKYNEINRLDIHNIEYNFVFIKFTYMK